MPTKGNTKTASTDETTNTDVEMKHAVADALRASPYAVCVVEDANGAETLYTAHNEKFLEVLELGARATPVAKHGLCTRIERAENRGASIQVKAESQLSSERSQRFAKAVAPHLNEAEERRERKKARSTGIEQKYDTQVRDHEPIDDPTGEFTHAEEAFGRTSEW